MWDLIVSVPDRCLSFYFSEPERAEHYAMALKFDLRKLYRCRDFTTLLNNNHSLLIGLVNTVEWLQYNMGHVMRKPVYVICEQQRRSLISAFVVRYVYSIVPKLAK